MENWDFNDLYKLHQTQSNSGTGMSNLRVTI